MLDHRTARCTNGWSSRSVLAMALYGLLAMKSVAAGSEETAQPLLSARRLCNSCTYMCAATYMCGIHICNCMDLHVLHTQCVSHMYIIYNIFTQIPMHSQSQFTPCLGTTANSLRGVNLEQLQTPLKTIQNLNHSPPNFKAKELVWCHCLGKWDDNLKNFYLCYWL